MQFKSSNKVCFLKTIPADTNIDEIKGHLSVTIHFHECFLTHLNFVIMC